ncbi:MAG TPA: TadE family protein [Acidimicrobiia bacterium]|jgi:hypothetical protein
MSRFRAQRDAGEGGVILVELVIVLPLLLMLAFGLCDMGLAWRDKVTVETAARAGARSGSNLGNVALTDYNILQTVLSGLGSIPRGNVDEVVVFNADSSGTVPSQCKGGTPVSGLCNVYLPSTFSLPSTSFGCNGGPDTWWCPTSRVVSQAAGTDYLGVYVKTHRSALTRLIAVGGFNISATAVFRLEPQS